jgi:hypothetical protein
VKRKVIQIAVAQTEDESGIHESFYALDSDGGIWWWRDGTSTNTAGWLELDAPWDSQVEKRKEKP